MEHVRTPAGVAEFKEPIGTPITKKLRELHPRKKSEKVTTGKKPRRSGKKTAAQIQRAKLARIKIAATKKKSLEVQGNKDGIAWIKSHPPSAQNVIDHWNKATSGEKEDGENWYKDAHYTAVAFSQASGGKVSVQQAAGILAVYSPQTAWATNMLRAARVIRTGKAVGGPGSGEMATLAQKTRAEKILAGEDWRNVLTGQKIRAFAALIEKGDDPDPKNPLAVIDRHALSVASGDRADTYAYANSKLGTKGKYNEISNVYVEAAKKISKQEGHPVSAHQVQAVTWLTRQRLNQQEDLDASSGKVARSAKQAQQAWDDWNEYATTNYPNLETAGTGYVSPEGAPDDVASAVVNLASVDEYFDLADNWVAFDAARAAARKAAHSGRDKADDPGGRLAHAQYAEHLAKKAKAKARVSYVKGDRIQKVAQHKATEWDQENEFEPGNKDQPLAEAWHGYQVPSIYKGINDALRGVSVAKGMPKPSPGWDEDYDGPDTSKEQYIKGRREAEVIGKMFDEDPPSTTLDKPTKFFRGFRANGGIDWSQKLTVGSTFQDKGMSSTTADLEYAQGWLSLGADDGSIDNVDTKAVVMEIRAPAGTKIVGGSDQFIETMFPPGSKFKIISSKVKKANGMNPLDESPVTSNYTHVVAELVA